MRDFWVLAVDAFGNTFDLEKPSILLILKKCLLHMYSNNLQNFINCSNKNSQTENIESILKSAVKNLSVESGAVSSEAEASIANFPMIRES